MEDGAQKQGYVESKWVDGANPGDYALIDTSPGTGEAPEQEAEPVHRDLLREPGYEEIAYGPTRLGATPAWEWVFRVSGDERVDYFFEHCSNGFAVLGSAKPSRFAALEPTFRAMAESVKGECE